MQYEVMVCLQWFGEIVLVDAVDERVSCMYHRVVLIPRPTPTWVLCTYFYISKASNFLRMTLSFHDIGPSVL